MGGGLPGKKHGVHQGGFRGHGNTRWGNQGGREKNNPIKQVDNWGGRLAPSWGDIGAHNSREIEFRKD